jgi:hypothetical protein
MKKKSLSLFILVIKFIIIILGVVILGSTLVLYQGF